MAEGVNKRAWLHLLKEGGRWTTSEIAEAIKATPHSVNTGVWRMEEQGMVIKHENPKGRSQFEFGVTIDCRIPHGVTLAELVKNGLPPAKEKP